MQPLTYTLVVHSGPDDGLCHERALAFAHALCSRGHRLNRAFFYGAGARVALPWDSSSLKNWQRLGEAGCELVLCSASADRYGVEQPPQGFLIAGLGSLMEAGLDADRIMSFA